MSKEEKIGQGIEEKPGESFEGNGKVEGFAKHGSCPREKRKEKRGRKNGIVVVVGKHVVGVGDKGTWGEGALQEQS